MWVGLGGAPAPHSDTPGNLVQAGTDVSFEQLDENDPNTRTSTYKTWWEDRGYSTTVSFIEGTACSNAQRAFTTHPHDHMRVYVSSNYGTESPDTAYFRIENLTTGCTLNFGTYAPGTLNHLPPSLPGSPASTAEWILELPANQFAGSTLGHINPGVDSAVFNAAKTGRNGTSLFVGQTSHNYDVATKDGTSTGTILAEPGWISCDGTFFRVYLGSSPETGCGGSGGGGSTSQNLAQNGGFNAGFNNWSLWSSSNWAIYGTGQTGNDPYEGSSFIATNTWQAGGGIYQVIPRTINTGDSYCASARVVTQGTVGGAGGLLALFLLGNTQEVGTQSFSNLPGGNGWTLIQTCVTASRSHTNLQIQFYPTVNDTKSLAIDAVGVYRNLAQNGGFNSGLGYWSLWPSSNWATYGAGVTGNSPYEGSQFASTNTTTSGGGIYQDISLTINTGDTFCASAQVVTQGTAGGGSGAFALFLRYNTDEGASTTFSGLPGGNGWTPVQVCITASRPHSSLRVQFYPTPNVTTISMDAVGVHYN